MRPELILGGAPLGGLFTPVSDADAYATLSAAWDAGIRSFDTAPHYGLGLSEHRLGAFLRGRDRTTYRISTKVGRLLEHDPNFVDGRDGYFGTPPLRRRWDFSADGARQSLEQSLTRLGIDRVDLLYIHDPDQHWAEALSGAYTALEQMRAEGLVERIGVGMNQVAMLERFVTETDIDTVMVAGRYTLLDRSAAPLLDLCGDYHVDVVVAGVFNSGLLANEEAPPVFDYEPASEDVLAARSRLAARCARHGVRLPAAAMHFAAAHPAVTALTFGARTSDEVTENVTHWKTPMPAGALADLTR